MHNCKKEKGYGGMKKIFRAMRTKIFISLATIIIGGLDDAQ
jgi:hypothetical protein